MRPILIYINRIPVRISITDMDRRTEWLGIATVAGFDQYASAGVISPLAGATQATIFAVGYGASPLYWTLGQAGASGGQPRFQIQAYDGTLYFFADASGAQAYGDTAAPSGNFSIANL